MTHPSEKAVQAAKKAIYAASESHPFYATIQMNDHLARDYAIAALTAALPHLQGWPEELTREMEEAVYKLDLGDCHLSYESLIDIYDAFRKCVITPPSTTEG